VSQKEKELERVILALRKQQELVLTTISVHLGSGNDITLEEAIIMIRMSAQRHEQTKEELERLQEKMKNEKS
jgi:hypothetical protein